MPTLWIGVAGFVGAVAREQLDSLVSRHARGASPWGTPVVIGLLAAWAGTATGRALA